ncbi:MAG: tRNA pseudouridine(13) synthase TruD [Xanthomonadales bacterium]|nr:tRNA pseudouridine(13) synthase TruD [Xanthomonadales bacterium]
MSLALPQNFSLDEIISPVSAYGRPALAAQFKLSAADFEVEEIPFIQPDGEGEHLWFWLQKTGANTQWVAGQLAELAGISARDVSWAGLKDRQSISRQYFSLQLPGKADPDWEKWEIEGAKILSAKRHSRKLKIGALKGNLFKIYLRDCVALEPSLSATEARQKTDVCLSQIQQLGVPNYFGPQRFGRGGGNLARAGSWLAGRGLGKRARNMRSLLISTVRSSIFNQLLAARVETGSWNQLLDGEWLQLDGSRSGFLYTDTDAEIIQRLNDFDLHPSGPLAGEISRRGDKQPQAEALAFEQTILQTWQPWIEGLEQHRVTADRRSLRLRPQNFRWHWQENDCCVEFGLPAGSYASVVLAQAFFLHETKDLLSNE